MPQHLYGNHIVTHVHNHELEEGNVLHVIGVISNPATYQSRYRIAREWIRHMVATPNVHLTIVEAAYGKRQHELAEVCKEVGATYVPLRTNSEIWIKENMINIGYRYTAATHPGAEYFAHIDCDVFFASKHWAQSALHELQHFAVIQPWSDCVDLGPRGEVLTHFKSFGHQHQKREMKQTHPGQPYKYAHTGFAWCWRKEFWERTKGLMDFPILGSSDHHMAFGMVGEMNKTIHQGMHANFFAMGYEWQRLAREVTHDEVGCVLGRIEHHFHGPKGRRFYRERWQILIENNFDPRHDLYYDKQGVIQLKPEKRKLEQDIHLYNRSRHEDSIEAF